MNENTLRTALEEVQMGLSNIAGMASVAYGSGEQLDIGLLVGELERLYNVAQAALDNNSEHGKERA